MYIKTPDTDELGTIESIKKRLRNGNYNESEEVMLRELGDESTTVLCQLVKDYFIDSGSALLMGGDEQFENMLQSVRCCNDPYLMTLIKSLPLAKQTQLGRILIKFPLIKLNLFSLSDQSSTKRSRSRTFDWRVGMLLCLGHCRKWLDAKSKRPKRTDSKND